MTTNETTGSPETLSIVQPGSRERLPQVGINTRDGNQAAFPENLPFNRETLLQFCAAFLSGRLQRPEDARKAMISAVPLSAKNTAHHQTKRKPPTEVRGISEQFKPQDPVVQVKLTPFHSTYWTVSHSYRKHKGVDMFSIVDQGLPHIDHCHTDSCRFGRLRWSEIPLSLRRFTKRRTSSSCSTRR